MTLAPFLNEDTGMWEILIRRRQQDPAPLPMGMKVQTKTRQQANNSLYMVCEQLGSMGIPARPEEIECN